MADREKVGEVGMNDIEEAISYIESTKKHLLHFGEIWYANYLDDAIELLKEQEAKKVIESTNTYTGLPITHCPKCGVSIDRYLYGRQHEGQTNYCSYCGQAVKWE